MYPTNPIRVKVFDLLGRLAGEAEYVGSSGETQQFRLDVSSFAAGVYYYGITGTDEVKSIVVLK